MGTKIAGRRLPTRILVTPLHVEADSEDEQTAHSGHFRDDRVAEQRLKHAGQQRDGAFGKERPRQQKRARPRRGLKPASRR